MIYDILPVNNYQGNNSSTIFDFDFYIENETQLDVFLFDENNIKIKLKYDIDYSISEFKNQNGGYIVFPLEGSKYDVLNDRQKISLVLTLPISQECVYDTGSVLRIETLEYSLDYLTRLIQILSRKNDLCIKIDECSDISPNELMDDIYNKAHISQNCANDAQKSLASVEDLKNETKLLFDKTVESSNRVDDVLESSLNKTQITNCITEIPQNIKLELVDGTLTLKAGSKVTIPNGVGVFEEVTITQDLSTTFDNNNQKMVFVNPARNGINHCNVVGQQSSGATSTLASSYKFWYDTTSNDVKFTNNSGTTWVSGYSLPICLVTKGSGIDQVFNGMGFIGSIVWLDKGVKALIPNGRNEDGTLKNIEVTSTQFSFAQVSTSDTRKIPFFINQNGVITIRLGLYREQETMPNDDTYLVWFDTNSNLMKRSSDGGATWQNLTICYLGDYQQANSSILTFETKKAFRAVDYSDALLKSDKTEIINWSVPNYNAGIAINSGYIAANNGLVIFTLQGYLAGGYGNGFVNDVKVADFYISGGGEGTVKSVTVGVPVQKGDAITFGYGGSGGAASAVFYPIRG